MLFALSNVWMARKQRMDMGECACDRERWAAPPDKSTRTGHFAANSAKRYGMFNLPRRCDKSIGASLGPVRKDMS